MMKIFTKSHPPAGGTPPATQHNPSVCRNTDSTPYIKMEAATSRPPSLAPQTVAGGAAPCNGGPLGVCLMLELVRRACLEGLKKEELEGGGAEPLRAVK